jgi:hypothetical protein
VGTGVGTALAGGGVGATLAVVWFIGAAALDAEVPTEVTADALLADEDVTTGTVEDTTLEAAALAEDVATGTVDDVTAEAGAALAEVAADCIVVTGVGVGVVAGAGVLAVVAPPICIRVGNLQEIWNS